MDTVVSEFLTCHLADLFESPEDMDRCHDALNERSRESVIMELLESIVACGAATHSYDQERNIDEFLATERLVQAWGKNPKGRTKNKKVARRTFHVTGDRSQYFNEDWLAPGKHDPLPSWET
jgi:hypothetical protein